jgi:hypothetical protein
VEFEGKGFLMDDTFVNASIRGYGMGWGIN